VASERTLLRILHNPRYTGGPFSLYPPVDRGRGVAGGDSKVPLQGVRHDAAKRSVVESAVEGIRAYVACSSRSYQAELTVWAAMRHKSYVTGPLVAVHLAW
jgi:hypothetical protein